MNRREALFATGALIAAVAFKGGIEILRSVREDKRSDSNDPVA